MKPEIHPDYQEAQVTCACGNTFKVGSTKAEIFTEACSVCHPFYTGTKKIMDTAGRVERFAKLVEKTKKKKEAKIIAKGAPKKLRTSKASKSKKIG
jgi:large subunit ribosomal protein L31